MQLVPSSRILQCNTIQVQTIAAAGRDDPYPIERFRRNRTTATEPGRSSSIADIFVRREEHSTQPFRGTAPRQRRPLQPRREVRHHVPRLEYHQALVG